MHLVHVHMHVRNPHALDGGRHVLSAHAYRCIDASDRLVLCTLLSACCSIHQLTERAPHCQRAQSISQLSVHLTVSMHPRLRQSICRPKRLCICMVHMLGVCICTRAYAGRVYMHGARAGRVRTCTVYMLSVGVARGIHRIAAEMQSRCSRDATDSAAAAVLCTTWRGARVYAQCTCDRGRGWSGRADGARRACTNDEACACVHVCRGRVRTTCAVCS